MLWRKRSQMTFIRVTTVVKRLQKNTDTHGNITCQLVFAKIEMHGLENKRHHYNRPKTNRNGCFKACFDQFYKIQMILILIRP